MGSLEIAMAKGSDHRRYMANIGSYTVQPKVLINQHSFFWARQLWYFTILEFISYTFSKSDQLKRKLFAAATADTRVHKQAEAVERWECQSQTSSYVLHKKRQLDNVWATIFRYCIDSLWVTQCEGDQLIKKEWTANVLFVSSVQQKNNKETVLTEWHSGIRSE